MSEAQAIIIFDGVCNLCNGAVRFITRHDPNEMFRFVALQSEQGQALLNQYQLSHVALDSVIVIKPERCYLRSDAVIEIAKSLTGIAVIFRWLGFLPKPLRDRCYDLIAKYRYQIFGRRVQCDRPTDNE
ncbi:thiol-disulfide oxidoreductase DCC family protein [Shewanella sp. 125m-7]